ncbi:MAG: hypothetical protein M3O50_22520 [Myxococcota bacterium]|nr:hypothetical protein [Myxococcota bacterium]
MNRSGRTFFGLAMAAGTLCPSGRALAAGSPVEVLDLDVSTCPAISFAELRRLLSVELSGRPALTVLSTEGSAPAETHVAVECTNPGSPLVVTLSVVERGHRASRSSDLSDVPAAHRPRLLAIAIAELMSEGSQGPTPASAPEHPAASSAVPASRADSPPPAVAGPGNRPPSWVFEVAAVTLHTAGLAPFVWGGLARASGAISEWLVVAADAEAMGASAPVSLGTARIVLVSASASILAQARWRSLAWDSGVGVRAGAARLSGTASDASVQSRTVVGAWGGPFVATRLAAATGRRLSFLLGIEGGYSPARVVGAVDGVTQVVLTQWWTDLSLGLGWRD